MNTTSDTTKKILQDKITKFLGKRFALKDYSDSEDNASAYEVNGVITRYDAQVNVQVTVDKYGYTPKYWQITDAEITLITRSIGTIKLGKEVIVSDPCYSRDVWCMAKLDNVKPGIWEVRVAIDTIDTWGKRCYILELQHQDVETDSSPDWKEHFELGVDSGTMSVFDDAYYNRKNGSALEFEADKTAKESFMQACFKLADNYAGIYHVGSKAVGVVCSSGCGDGTYPLYVAEKDGEIVALKISFM